MYLVTNKKEECCGCSACQQICNVNAISIIPDEEGFLFPIKNKDICTVFTTNYSSIFYKQ